MKRIPKHKWINALLSNYKQGKGYLKQRKIGDEEYRFSVLGVLEDVYIEHIDYTGPEHLATWHEHTNEDGTRYWTRDSKEHRLSLKAAKWAKIPCNPTVELKVGDDYLWKPMSVLNDEYDVPLTDFVNIIKEQL